MRYKFRTPDIPPESLGNLLDLGGHGADQNLSAFFAQFFFRSVETERCESKDLPYDTRSLDRPDEASPITQQWNRMATRRKP